MEWWSVFFRVRKVVFFFISISSLLWATVFAAYLAHLWNHLMWSQRGIMLGIIGANLFTAIMVYLMAVVVFRIWLDLARVVFLLLLHIATALVFTLFGSNFSCATFRTRLDCKHVDLAFVIGSWVMTGLFLGYIPYLLLMVRIPRPVPKITPNTLLHAPPSRRSSVSSFGSVSSTTRLIREDSIHKQYPVAVATTRAASYISYQSSAPPVPAQHGLSPMYTGGSYGTIDTIAGLPPTRVPISRSVSVTPPTPKSNTASTPPSLQTGEVLSRSSSRTTTRPLPSPPVFLNPFLDPISRHNTPQTAWSQMSFSDSTSVHSRTNSELNNWPPLMPIPAAAASTRPSMSTPEPPPANAVPVWSAYERRWVYSSSSRPERPFSARPNQVATGTALRNHTATPHSIHSVAASISHYVPESLQPSRGPATPNPIHARAGSDPGPVPLYRPATVPPRIPLTYTSTLNSDGPLPNPFPRVVAATTSNRPEVRRFGSVPSAHFYTGQGGTYLNASMTAISTEGMRNATHLAGALGRTPPRAEAAMAADPRQWKALVVNAATGRTV